MKHDMRNIPEILSLNGNLELLMKLKAAEKACIKRGLGTQGVLYAGAEIFDTDTDTMTRMLEIVK